MTNVGYIKLYRSIKDQPWYSDSQAVHLFVHLMLNATHEERQVLFGGKLKILQPGQLVTGRNKLSQETGINRNKIERCLKVFQECGQIEQQTSNISRCISVLNWDKFQKGEQQTSNERATSEQQTSNERALYKNDKNNKNEKNDNNVDESAAENSDWIEALKADDLFREQVAMKHRIFGADFDRLLDDFTGTKKALGELNHKSFSDFRRNFLYWIPKNLNAAKNDNSTGKTRNHANLIDEETARRVLARVTENDR